MTILAKDLNDNPIPALRLKGDGAHQVSYTDTAAENTVPFSSNTRVISLYATSDVYIKFGVSDTVSATNLDHFFPANTYYDISIGGGDTGQFTYISAIRVTDNGTLYISEKV